MLLPFPETIPSFTASCLMGTPSLWRPKSRAGAYKCKAATLRCSACLCPESCPKVGSGGCVRLRSLSPITTCRDASMARSIPRPRSCLYRRECRPDSKSVLGRCEIRIVLFRMTQSRNRECRFERVLVPAAFARTSAERPTNKRHYRLTNFGV